MNWRSDAALVSGDVSAPYLYLHVLGRNKKRRLHTCQSMSATLADLHYEYIPV